MACTFQDHDNLMSTLVADGYLGVGLPSAYSPQHIQHFNTGYPVFHSYQWSQYTLLGCQWWVDRVTHWTNQLNNNTYNPYQTNLKMTKRKYAETMHLLCGCTIPLPLLNPNVELPTLNKKEEDEKIVKDYTDNAFIEYDKLDK